MNAPTTHAARPQVLLAYTRMASKQKGEAEAAVGALLDLAAADPNNVPVLLALAHGFMLLKQVSGRQLGSCD